MTKSLRNQLAKALCAAAKEDPQYAWQHYAQDADAALSVLRQWLADEGLAIVPKKATGAMFSAALQRDDHGDLYHGIYTAMISAAPDALDTKGEG
jgi:hypothetical protein